MNDYKVNSLVDYRKAPKRIEWYSVEHDSLQIFYKVSHSNDALKRHEKKKAVKLAIPVSISCTLQTLLLPS